MRPLERVTFLLSPKLIAVGEDLHAVDSFGSTPLHRAANNGHAAAVKELLACGADVTLLDYIGDKPLHDATQCGNASITTDTSWHGSGCKWEE